MSPRVRAVAGFKSFTDPQLITTGRGVVKEMKDNPNFPNPPEELKTLESAVEELSAALAAQVQGGTAATAHKKNKRDAVIELLVKLAHYVQDNCGQNLSGSLVQRFPTRNQQPCQVACGKGGNPEHRSRQEHRAGPEAEPRRQCADI